MSKYIIFQEAKLIMAINNLKINEERNLKGELEEFRKICNDCYTLAIASLPLGLEIYKLQARRLHIDLPILSKFFEDIKGYSKEAYECITEGYDILNLKEFLICENITQSEAFDVIRGICKYSKYITYAIEKLFKEQNEDKQIIMLRGLIGM